MSGNILIYPLLKDRKIEIEENAEAPSEEELAKLADHYIAEIARHLKNHEFQMNPALLKDLQIASDFLKSALFRNVGIYHHLQDTVDSLEDMEATEVMEFTEEELAEEDPETGLEI